MAANVVLGAEVSNGVATRLALLTLGAGILGSTITLAADNVDIIGFLNVMSQSHNVLIGNGTVDAQDGFYCGLGSARIAISGGQIRHDDGGGFSGLILTPGGFTPIAIEATGGTTFSVTKDGLLEVNGTSGTQGIIKLAGHTLTNIGSDLFWNGKKVLTEA